MDDLASARKLVDALLDPACYPHEVGGIELIETHISWVLLTGRFAYKIKKPLRLDFLDFSTLERRRTLCAEELRLNRRLAPELYLDVVSIGGGPQAPRIGTEPAIEYAVKLRQFPKNAGLDRAVEDDRVSPRQILELAESIARFHGEQPAADHAAAHTEALTNLDGLERALEAAGQAYSFDALRAWTSERIEALAPRFEARRRAGAVREGHGDLHLENLVVIEERIVPFDMLEFSVDLRTTDVIDEAAFLVMDLMVHGRDDLAFVFLNRYLEVTGDYAGLDLLPFYLVYRALVRAKVRVLKAVQTGDMERFERRVLPYLRLADALLRPRRPLLAITHGLSGSGKTTVTSELIPRLPALRVRSDLERKRLRGVAPDTHEAFAVGHGRYTAAATAETYAALERAAHRALDARLDVIVDATFLAESERAAFRASAERCGAAFAIIDCVAAEHTLRKRVRSRAAAGSDASEATEAVLDAQLRSADRLTAAEMRHRVEADTSAAIDYDALAETLRQTAR